jgi:hypothetical protein
METLVSTRFIYPIIAEDGNHSPNKPGALRLGMTGLTCFESGITSGTRSITESCQVHMTLLTSNLCFLLLFFRSELQGSTYPRWLLTTLT